MKNKPYQTGLTLIELMIAMLLGVFLIGGILQIFISSKQTYRMQENLSRLQENGRFALDFISKDIRMTSYWGCLPKSPGDIAGFDNDTLNSDPRDSNTDTIILKGAFTTIPPPVICSPSVNQTALYYTHPSSTIKYRINNKILQKSDKNGPYQDLIEGIENIQILYGADADGDNAANYYVSAETPGLDMERVVSLRFSLLVRSIDDNLAAQPIPYTYNGITTTATSTPPVTDRRIRRVFTSTIAVRNRLP